MSRFLLDANLSPETTDFLRGLGLDVVDLLSQQLTHLKDPDVIAIAKTEGRVLITFDLDFGEIYFRAGDPFGVIILRMPDQTIEAVNRTLEILFTSVAETLDLDHSLVVVEPNRVRIAS